MCTKLSQIYNRVPDDINPLHLSLAPLMNQDNVTIFWDYASTHTLSANSTISNYDIVANIRSACLELGSIKSFRAYGTFSGHGSTRSSTAHSELTASGVTVIDFPDDVQKEGGLKVMLVDMITHAWDYPTGHIHVIITGDRDVAYAIAMLRMRRIKVVVISSVTAHPDLTAHASIKLDWTKTVLGYQNGAPRFTNPSDVKPLPSDKLAPSSFASFSHMARPLGPQFQDSFLSAQTEKPVKAAFEPEVVELHDIHPRGRRHSVFSSYDPQRFESFGNIGDASLTLKTQRELFGFGHGPLFPRQAEERPRAESVPPHAFDSSNPLKSVLSSFYRDDKAASISTSSTEKGKARASSVFQDTFPPPAKADMPYSGSIFEPFADTTTSFGLMSNLPPSESPAPIMSRSSSSSSLQPTNFSAVKKPDTTAPTSAQSETADNSKAMISEKEEKAAPSTAPVISSSTESTPNSMTTSTRDDILNPPSYASSRRNSTSTIEAKSQISQATEYGPTRASEPVLEKSTPIQTIQPIAGPSQSTARALPTTPTPKPSPKAVPKPKPKVSALNPSVFQPLITVLRQQQAATPKSSLGVKLVEQNSRVYELAGIKVKNKFKAYIAAAVQAGVVSESRDIVTLSAAYKT